MRGVSIMKLLNHTLETYRDYKLAVFTQRNLCHLVQVTHSNSFPIPLENYFGNPQEGFCL